VREYLNQGAHFPLTGINVIPMAKRSRSPTTRPVPPAQNAGWRWWS